MLKLFGKISLVITLAFLLSIGVDYLYRKTNNLKYPWPRNVFILPEIHDKYELVALGNSHAEAGFNFEGYKVKSLSLSSVAQSFEYDLAMLKMYQHQIKDNAIILITVSPLSFSQKIPGRHDDANTNYYDGRLSPILIPHLKLAEYLQMQIVPFLRTGYIWRGDYSLYAKEKAMDTFAKAWEKPEKPKSETGSIITSQTPPTTTKKDTSLSVGSAVPSFDVKVIQRDLTDPPDPSDQRLIESARLVMNKWYHTSDFDPKYFNGNRKDLQEIIEFALKHDWRPVLITLPVSQVLLDDLQKDYMRKYVYDHLEKANKNNLPYINFSEDTRLTKNRYLFNNSDHLNYKGAAVTSYLLLQELIKQKYLPKEVDGYDYSQL